MKVICVLALVAGALAQPKMDSQDGNLDVSIASGAAFSVTCVDDGAVACQGDEVQATVDGRCEPVQTGMKIDEATAHINQELQTQLKEHRQELKSMVAGSVQAIHDDFDAHYQTLDTSLTNGETDTATFTDSVTKTHDKLMSFKTNINDTFLDASQKITVKLDATKESAKDKLNTADLVKDYQCRVQGKIGYDMEAKKCLEPIMTGSSCLDIYNKNVEAKSETHLRNGIYTIKVGNADRKVYCDMKGSFDNGSPGWTLVAVISRYSRKHMLSDAYGTLIGPNQPKPWKLSNADINALVKSNKDQGGALSSAYKFYCTRVSASHSKTGSTFSGYQYFKRDCVFNANGPYAGSNNHCNYWSHDESMEQYYGGYRDYNSCGLGGHHRGTSFAAYGWHYCNRESNIKSQSERVNPSTSTGCGHNNGFGSGLMVAGDGHLWIR